jgi:hypothetical protein
MSQTTLVTGDACGPTELGTAAATDARQSGPVGEANLAIAEWRRVSALASDELAAWARILHDAA